MGCLQNKLNILVRSLFIAIMDFPVAIITFLEQADIIPCCVWFLFPRSHDDVPSFRFEILYARAMVRTRPHHELMGAGSHHLIGFKLEDRLVSFFVQNRTILYLFERCVSAGWSNDLNNRFSVRFPHELVSQKGYFIFWELVLLPATHVLPLGGQHLGKSNGGRNSGIQPQIRTTHDWIAYTYQLPAIRLTDGWHKFYFKTTGIGTRTKQSQIVEAVVGHRRQSRISRGMKWKCP